MLNSKTPTIPLKIIDINEYRKKRVEKLKKEFRQKAIKAAVEHAENYFPKEEE